MVLLVQIHMLLQFYNILYCKRQHIFSALSVLHTLLILAINPRGLHSRFAAEDLCRIFFKDNFDLVLLNKQNYFLSSCPLFTFM